MVILFNKNNNSVYLYVSGNVHTKEFLVAYM